MKNDIYSMYSMEFAFSLVTTTLVWNIVLLVRIRYGNAMITHLTTRSYLISMTLLITLLLEIVSFIIYSTINPVYFVSDLFTDG